MARVCHSAGGRGHLCTSDTERREVELRRDGLGLADNTMPGFVYFSDDGDLLALRYDSWKIVFREQRVHGTMQLWAEPFVTLRVPKLFNLRTDPFERADVTSNTYWDWFIDHAYMCMAAHALITQFLATFQEFPPQQKAASFTIDQVLEKRQAAITSGR
jgi:arylsulfatase